MEMIDIIVSLLHFSANFMHTPTTTIMCLAADMVFKKFRDLNDQHKDEYDNITTPFKGISAHIHK